MSETKLVALAEKQFKSGSGRKGGGKLKSHTDSRTKLIDTYLRNTRSKEVATLGLFRYIPGEIQRKIHDKKSCKNITVDDLKVVADLILKNINNTGVHIKDPTGFEILDLLSKKQSLSHNQSKAFKLRTVFCTQERQLILG